MSKIKVHPARRATLSKAGLLTFMSPGGQGLAGLANVCQTPGCACLDILLRLLPIDFRVESVSCSKGSLRFNSNPLGGLPPAMDAGRWIDACLDVDTGELMLREESASDPEADALLSPLREALDGELLEDFARLRGRLKGKPPLADEPRLNAVPDDWNPGDQLGFDEAFAVSRLDCYPLEEAHYEAIDLYCPDPDCECLEVSVIFVKIDESHDNVGAVRVRLSSGEVSFEHDTDDEALIPELWRRFVHRHRGIALLSDRNRRMKDFGDPLFANLRQQRSRRSSRPMAPAVRAEAKIGRNDRCPCGSGKKYKKCCMP